MKTTDFAVLLNKFFVQFLPNERGSTPLTIDSYRYVFIRKRQFWPAWTPPSFPIYNACIV